MTDETLDLELLEQTVQTHAHFHTMAWNYQPIDPPTILRLIALARASVPEGDQEVSSSVAESAAQGTDSLAAPEACAKLDEGEVAEALERAWREVVTGPKPHVAVFNTVGRHFVHHLEDVRREFAARAAKP